MSLVYRDLVDNPKFRPFLLAFKDIVDDSHPNGLRFQEDKSPLWKQPDMVAGMTKLLIKSHIKPNVVTLTCQGKNISEDVFQHMIKGINPFASSIPEELKQEFEILSYESVRKGSISVGETCYLPELIVYGSKM